MLMSKDHTSVVYDNLVIEAGTVGSIQLQKGQGTLKRGAVLDSNGKLLGARTPSLVETFVETKDETYDPSKTYFTKCIHVVFK